MKSLFIVLFVYGFLQAIIINPIIAQEETDRNKTSVSKDTVKSDTLTSKINPVVSVSPIPLDKEEHDTTVFKINELKFFGYPYAFYTPETELAFGIGGIAYFRTALQASQKPSKITVGGYYTTNSQYYVSIKPRIYLPGITRTYIESDFYFSYEIGKFYGVGNTTKETENVNYKTSSFGIYLENQKRGIFIDPLQVGLIYEYVHVKMKDKMNNQNLYDTTLAGSEGGKVGGLGLSWSYDYRDNISFPSVGGLYKISGIFYGRDLGGYYTYNRYQFDFRQYVAPIGDHILAFQLYSDLNSSAPPFFRMPALGGSSRMRGFFEGRYRDINYITGQLEYRKIVWWRIGVAAFYAVGDVFGNFNQLKLSELKQSYGLGLRFVFDTKEKINIRADFGITKESTGVYFSIDEAF